MSPLAPLLMALHTAGLLALEINHPGEGMASIRAYPCLLGLLTAFLHVYRATSPYQEFGRFFRRVTVGALAHSSAMLVFAGWVLWELG